MEDQFALSEIQDERFIAIVHDIENLSLSSMAQRIELEDDFLVLASVINICASFVEADNYKAAGRHAAKRLYTLFC